MADEGLLVIRILNKKIYQLFMYEFDETGICKQLQIRLCFGTAFLMQFFHQEIVSDRDGIAAPAASEKEHILLFAATILGPAANRAHTDSPNGSRPLGLFCGRLGCHRKRR